MRLPLIPPDQLSSQQKSLYDEMRKGIASNFNAFKVEREDGALMGPWNPWLHEPGIGKAIWDLTLAMTANASLPDNVRQIAILVVGALQCGLRDLRAYRGRGEGSHEGREARNLGCKPQTERSHSGRERGVRFCFRARTWRHASRTALQVGNRDIRTAWHERADLPGRPLLSRLDDAQWVQRAGA
jgi:hypothetical protein